MSQKDKVLGKSVSEQWRQYKRMNKINPKVDRESRIIDIVNSIKMTGALPAVPELESNVEALEYEALKPKPSDQRAPYTIGEHLVDKMPYRPPKYQMEKYRKGEISHDELMRPEKILKGAVDLLAPQDAKEVAEIAVLGGAAKTVGSAYRGGKRLMTNIPMPEGYAVRSKIGQIVDAPFKNKLYAMKYDVPVSPTREIGRKKLPEGAPIDELAKSKGEGVYPYQWDAHGKQLDDLGFVAHELLDNKRVREKLERRISDGDNVYDNRKLLQQHAYSEFIAIQNYYLRRGLKMPSTPEGFNNKKFLEMFPEYKPVAKEWKRMMDNIMEYELTDPRTGKKMPYASFKKLPYNLQQSMVNANFGKSVVKEGDGITYGPFGGYSVGKISKQIPGMPKGYKEERMFYEDKSDFNADLGKSLGSAFQAIGNQWRPWKKESESLKDILTQPSFSSTYKSSYGGDVARGVIDKMMTPMTWLGEHARGVESALYNYPRHIGQGGAAARTLRVFTPKTMKKIRKESKFGTRKVGGEYSVPDSEVIEWYLKNPKSSGYNPDYWGNQFSDADLKLSPDKKGTFRLIQWVPPSKKENKFADDILGFDQAVKDYQYTGVKRFGREVPDRYSK